MMTHFMPIFLLLWWSGTKPTVSPVYRVDFNVIDYENFIDLVSDATVQLSETGVRSIKENYA